MQLGVDFTFGLGPPVDAEMDTSITVFISKIFPHISKFEMSWPNQASLGPVHAFDCKQCLGRLGQVLCACLQVSSEGISFLSIETKRESSAWVPKLLIAKGHTRYCRLVLCAARGKIKIKIKVYLIVHYTLFWNFYNICLIYIRDFWPHNTTWRDTDWRLVI